MAHDGAELQVAARYAQRFEADLAVSRLATAGIEALVTGPDAGGTLPAGLGGVRVLVHREDLAAAREILAPDPTPDPVPAPRSRRGMSPIHWAALLAVAATLAWVIVSAFRQYEH